jgi:hypothetical protein
MRITVALLAAIVGVVTFYAPLIAQQKTGKACQEEWRANRAANEARGITEKTYVSQCRMGSTMRRLQRLQHLLQREQQRAPPRQPLELTNTQPRLRQKADVGQVPSFGAILNRKSITSPDTRTTDIQKRARICAK